MGVNTRQMHGASGGVGNGGHVTPTNECGISRKKFLSCACDEQADDQVGRRFEWQSLVSLLRYYSRKARCRIEVRAVIIVTILGCKWPDGDNQLQSVSAGCKSQLSGTGH